MSNGRKYRIPIAINYSAIILFVSQLESLKSEQDVSWEIDAASLFQWIRHERELLSNAFETFDTTLKSSVYWLRQLFYFSKRPSEEFSRVLT